MSYLSDSTNKINDIFLFFFTVFVFFFTFNKLVDAVHCIRFFCLKLKQFQMNDL